MLVFIKTNLPTLSSIEINPLLCVVCASDVVFFWRRIINPSMIFYTLILKNKCVEYHTVRIVVVYSDDTCTKNVDIRHRTCEKRHKKWHKNGCPLFFVSDFRFLHTPGKEKKRTFTKSGGLLLDSFFTAFVPLFCRNISYIISVRRTCYYYSRIKRRSFP
jgi:hypothetical protein